MKNSVQAKQQQILATPFKQHLESEISVEHWLNDIRRKNYSAYLEQPLPSRKIEHWKYNDSAFLAQSEFVRGASLQKDTPLKSDADKLLTDAYIFTFVNGIFSQERSSNLLSSNISLIAFSNAKQSQVEIICECLDTAEQNKNLLIQLNTVLSQDGWLIEIEANATISKPIYLVQINSPSNDGEIFSNQVIINCGNNSQCEVIEHFISEGNKTAQLTLQQTIIRLQNNSQCRHSRLNLESSPSKQVSRLLVILETKSQLNSFCYSQGSLLNKTDIDICHQGQYSESHLTGIYLPANTQQIDYHTNIEHRAPNCTSREVFRGIIADQAKATFNGKIHIFKDAQKSDAQLSNKNLLLTNQAEINTKPELEIYADDVICAHGATVAKIDDQAIYYIQTRGIDSTKAKKMLSIGFINELLEKIHNESLKKFLQEQIQQCLSDLK